MPAPATTDDLFAVIDRSGLLTAELLATYRPPPGRLMSADALLSRMTREGVITPFHAKHLAAGRHRGFFLSDKYKLLAHLGSGGIGQVYLCEHLLLNRLVAVKVLQTAAAGESAGAVERFFREARAVATLDDPNIVRVFDMDRSGAAPFMVMEYVDGTNLHAVVARGGPMSVARAANYARQAALGLAHAHEAGLVHRDIKPGNLLVDRGGVVKLLDLGLARFFIDTEKNKNLTSQFDANTVVGTADFIAPEQTYNSSGVDIRADIYGLGGTLYYFLAGRSPFEHGTISQKLQWHQTVPPPPVSDFRKGVPDGLIAVLDKMLAKNPNDRYTTPDEVVAALAPWGDRPIPPPSPEEMPRMPASDYRLGLSPPPSGSKSRFAIPALSRPTQPELSSSGQPTVDLTPPPPRRDDTPDAVVGSDTAPSPTVVEPPPAAAPLTPGSAKPPVSRRRWLWIGGSVFAVGLTAVLWVCFREGDRPTPGVPSPPAGAPVPLAAGGSTFARKPLRNWTEDYPARSGARFTPYEGVGSGNGIAGLLAGRYQIGCTDAYLSDAELDAARRDGRELLHIPVVIGAVVPAYNLPELTVPLKFTPAVLADIYLGTVTEWNAPSLRECNPNVPLPNRPIRVAYRSDASGTTEIWTEFLHKKNDPWRQTMGPPATSYKLWPVGGGAVGNEGVGETVARSVGALGYVELGHALDKNLTVGAVENAAGQFVAASSETVAAAAAAPEGVRKDLRVSLIDMPGRNVYPICGTTWAVFDANATNTRERKAVADFLWWVTHDGQANVGSRGFAPLPKEVVGVIESKLAPLR